MKASRSDYSSGDPLVPAAAAHASFSSLKSLTVTRQHYFRTWVVPRVETVTALTPATQGWYVEISLSAHDHSPTDPFLGALSCTSAQKFLLPWCPAPGGLFPPRWLDKPAASPAPLHGQRPEPKARHTNSPPLHTDLYTSCSKSKLNFKAVTIDSS